MGRQEINQEKFLAYMGNLDRDEFRRFLKTPNERWQGWLEDAVVPVRKLPKDLAPLLREMRTSEHLKAFSKAFVVRGK